LSLYEDLVLTWWVGLTLGLVLGFKSEGRPISLKIFQELGFG